MSEKPVASIKTLARYEPDIVYIGTGEYVAECVRADDGDYYLAADVDAAIEALRAEVERLRADRDSWEQQASDRVADWHAEYLRAERLAEALRRAHRWGGLGKGWDSGVALDLIAWIESGMHGELPPLPDYLAAALAQEDRNG